VSEPSESEPTDAVEHPDERQAPERETDLAAAARVLDEPGGLPAALEAILMVADTPVATTQLATVLARPEVEIRSVLDELAAGYERDHRGFVLREQGGGWRYYSSPTFAPVVEAFVLDGQTARLTQASLETLAVIAYRQPVSRGRVAAIRGVNVDGVVRTLLSRGLIEEAGQDPDGGANLYRTSAYFLERLGLRSLEDLPPLAPYLPEMDELEDIIDRVDGGARALNGGAE
jgi:segregation and condensation protein B